MIKAIITGGSSGIGREICHLLGNKGYEIINVSRRAESKDDAIPTGQLKNCKTEICDVSDFEALQKLVYKYQPEILINNAGVLHPDSEHRDFELQSFDNYRRKMDINFGAAVFGTQAALKYMLPRKNGCIVNIASTAGIHADPHNPIYGASKAALISFTKSIAAQYSPVRSNCICPGPVLTQFAGPPKEEFDKQETARIPLGRFANPTEIAELVLFIINYSYINGAAIIIDGGRLCGIFK